MDLTASRKIKTLKFPSLKKKQNSSKYVKQENLMVRNLQEVTFLKLLIQENLVN